MKRASPVAVLVVGMRLPRVAGALCVGGALATAGCMLQSLLRNPLASPFVIGTAQAAGFGAPSWRSSSACPTASRSASRS